jgi:hypothetical protein
MPDISAHWSDRPAVGNSRLIPSEAPVTLALWDDWPTVWSGSPVLRETSCGWCVMTLAMAVIGVHIIHRNSGPIYRSRSVLDTTARCMTSRELTSPTNQSVVCATSTKPNKTFRPSYLLLCQPAGETPSAVEILAQ